MQAAVSGDSGGRPVIEGIVTKIGDRFGHPIRVEWTDEGTTRGASEEEGRDGRPLAMRVAGERIVVRVSEADLAAAADEGSKGRETRARLHDFLLDSLRRRLAPLRIGF